MNEIIERIDNNKLDSFWYHGETVAIYETETRYLICEGSGAIEVYMPKTLEDDTEELYKGDNAVLHAEELGYDDEDIELLLNEDKFRLNNWFGFTYEEGDITTEFDDVASDYDEAIEMMQDYMSEFPEDEEEL